MINYYLYSTSRFHILVDYQRTDFWLAGAHVSVLYKSRSYNDKTGQPTRSHRDGPVLLSRGYFLVKLQNDLYDFDFLQLIGKILNVSEVEFSKAPKTFSLQLLVSSLLLDCKLREVCFVFYIFK